MAGRIYAGVDVGSLSSEALVLGDDGVLSYSIVSTGANPPEGCPDLPRGGLG